MTKEETARRCPKCGARLNAERVDHHLTGQERVFCPQHGEIGSLRTIRAHDYADDTAQPDEIE